MCITATFYIGLSIGLSIAFSVFCLCYLYVRKINKTYDRYEDAKNQSALITIGNSIMRKEDLDEIKINKSSHKK